MVELIGWTGNIFPARRMCGLVRLLMDVGLGGLEMCAACYWHWIRLSCDLSLEIAYVVGCKYIYDCIKVRTMYSIASLVSIHT